MRLKEYGRNPKMRKVYIQQPGLLLVGVDVSKAKHSVCIDTQTNVSCRKLDFTHTREGFKLFEQTLRDHLAKNTCRRLLIAMEPSGIYWQGFYERLRSCGYDVCLVSCQAVRNNRKTMHDGASKTDEKDAYSVFAAFATPLEEPWNEAIHAALLDAQHQGHITYTWKDRIGYDGAMEGNLVRLCHHAAQRLARSGTGAPTRHPPGPVPRTHDRDAPASD
jgi:hypothetical protein